MLKRVLRGAIVALFVAANIAIAKPADAGLIQVECPDPDGGEEYCCEWCLIFCGCPYQT